MLASCTTPPSKARPARPLLVKVLLSNCTVTEETPIPSGCPTIETLHRSAQVKPYTSVANVHSFLASALCTLMLLICLFNMHIAILTLSILFDFLAGSTQTRASSHMKSYTDFAHADFFETVGVTALHPFQLISVLLIVDMRITIHTPSCLFFIIAHSTQTRASA